MNVWRVDFISSTGAKDYDYIEIPLCSRFRAERIARNRIPRIRKLLNMRKLEYWERLELMIEDEPRGSS